MPRAGNRPVNMTIEDMADLTMTCQTSRQLPALRQLAGIKRRDADVKRRMMHEDEHWFAAPFFELCREPGQARRAHLAILFTVTHGIQHDQRADGMVYDILDEARIIERRLCKGALESRAIVVIADQQVIGNTQLRENLVGELVTRLKPLLRDVPSQKQGVSIAVQTIDILDHHAQPSGRIKRTQSLSRRRQVGVGHVNKFRSHHGFPEG